MTAVLDLFSAAAGGWSLGMHRAGCHTVAACEAIEWRRALYAENNPGIPIYDDVRTLTAARLLDDLGYLPSIVVGSPPCQDISSANTSGKGVEGERSGLYFEAIRIIGEVRPRWFALENSANLRTRGADAVLAALEALGYACWAVVVRAGDIGANHVRPRSWLIGCDLDQVTDPDGHGWAEGRGRRWSGVNLSDADDPDGSGQAADADEDQLWQQSGRCGWPSGRGAALSADHVGDAAQDGCGSRRSGRCAEPASGVSLEACGNAARNTPDPERPRHQGGIRQPGRTVAVVSAACIGDERSPGAGDAFGSDQVADPDSQGQSDRAEHGEVGGGAGLGGDAAEPWAEWNLGLAGHLRLDDGLSAWVAGTRVAVGGPKGTAAASLIVEAFGDAVVPQIPEAIGHAILRTEAALAAIYGRPAA